MNRQLGGKSMKKSIALLLALVLLLAACGPAKPADPATSTPTETSTPAETSTPEEASTPAEQPLTTSSKELTIAYSSEPEHLDYVISAKTSDLETTANIVDSLLENDNHGKIVPCLAESYESNADATVFTFKLKPGVKWVTNTGEEYEDLKADDFVTGLRHAAEFDSEAAWLLQGVVKGYTEYMASDFSDAEWEKVGVKALDDLTVQYTMEDATPYFPSMTTYSILFPINRAFLESKGNGCKLGAPNKEDCQFGTLQLDSVLYNGGYLLETIDLKSQIVMKKNPTYWDADKIFIEKITKVYDEGGDVYSVMKAFEAGTYPQAALNTGWEDYQQYLDKYKNNAYYTLPNSTAFALLFNYNRQSFNETNYATNEAERAKTKKAIHNENFRKALRAAYDRVAIGSVTAPEDLVRSSMRNINNFPGAGTQSDGTLYYDEVIKQYEIIAGEKRDLSDGADPFLSKEEALAYIEKAKAEGVEFPVHLDMLVVDTSKRLTNQGQAMKKAVELNTDGQIIVELVMRSADVVTNIAYRNDDPAKMDYDISTFTGWGPDFADPKSFVDTQSAKTGYYLKAMGLQNTDKDGNIADVEIKEAIGMMEYEKLYREADAIKTDLDARYKAFAKADAWLVHKCWYVPTTMQTRGQVVSRYVPFSKSYSEYGASDNKFKGLRLQDELVTIEQREAAYQEWLKNR